VELAEIRKLLADGFPHCAQAELNRWIAWNGLTPDAADLKMRIGNAFAQDEAQWEKFLETVAEFDQPGKAWDADRFPRHKSDCGLWGGRA